MATTLPLYKGTEFANLDTLARARIRDGFGAPISEGPLTKLPTIPSGKRLACIYTQNRRERLVTMDTWQEVSMLQNSPTNSQFFWYLIDDDAGIADSQRQGLAYWETH